MIVVAVVLGLIAVAATTYAGHLRDERDLWVGIADASITAVSEKSRVIDMLMERELSGTWLPNLEVKH